MTLLRRSAAPMLAAAVMAPLIITATAGSAAAAPGCSATPSFDFSIPEPVGPPGSGALQGGSSIVFSGVGSDTKTYSTVTDISGDPLQVSELTCYGGSAVDSPAVAGTGADTYTIFVRGAGNNRIFERRVTPTSTGAFVPVGTGLTSAGPAAVHTPDNTMHLVVRGTNGNAFYASSTVPGVWSGFTNLGGNLQSAPTLIQRPGGGIAAFVRGPGNAVFINTLIAGRWSGWQPVPGGGATLGNPTATVGFSAGRLDLFVAGTTGGLFQQTWTTTTGWGGWKRLDNTLPASARLSSASTPGKVIVYAAAEDIVAYKQYNNGWQQYFLAPYTCEECLPTAGAAAPQGKVAPRHRTTVWERR